MTEETMSPGEKLRIRRTELGMSLETAAKMMGCHSRLLEQVEIGEFPGGDTIYLDQFTAMTDSNTLTEQKIVDTLGNEWEISLLPDGGLEVTSYGQRNSRNLQLMVHPRHGNVVQLFQLDVTGKR